MRIVLYHPEIPPNTGNIARLCAATKTPLHLIEPLGFTIDDKHLKRAGLDYWPHVNVIVHPDWQDFARHEYGRIVLTSARTGTRYCDFSFRQDDCIVMGPETTGLPATMTDQYPDVINLPIKGQVRSLNLSTATGIMLYEGLRQTDGF